MFEGLFKQPAQTATPATGSMFDNLFKTGVADSPFAKLNKLSPSIGGGAFKTIPGQEGQPVLEGHTTYGGLPEKPGMERDDIIPVALGGSNNSPANMRYEGTLPKDQQKPGDLTPTDETELQNIRDFHSGKITLAEARANVLHVKQQEMGLAPTEEEQTTKGQYPSALLETGEKITSGFMDAMGWLGDKVTKGVAGAIGTFPTMLASGGKKGLVQSFMDSPDFIKKMTTEPFNVAEEQNPELAKNTSFQFGREFVKGLTDAGLQTAGALALDAIGSRVATTKTKISVSPEQMKDLMTGREPQGAPMSESDKATVMKEFLKPGTQKEIVKQANQEGLTISKSSPASPARQFVGHLIGGAPAEGTEVKVGEKVVKPETPFQKLAESQKALPTGKPEPSITPEKPPISEVKPEEAKLPAPTEKAPIEPSKAVSPKTDREIAAQMEAKDHPTIPAEHIKQIVEDEYRADPEGYQKEVEKFKATLPKESAVKEKTTPSPFAKSIETKAIEAKLTKGFSQVAGYDASTIKEQARLFGETANKGLEHLTKVVRGDVPLPEGAKGGPFLVALEEYLKKNPNVDLQYEMANSPLSTGVSEAASELGLMQNREPDSVTAHLREIKKNLEGKAQKVDTEKISKRIKAETKKVNLSKEELSWDKFLDDLTC